jgi:hypothetical protein
MPQQDAPEIKDKQRQVRQGVVLGDTGKGFADGRLSFMAVSPQWEVNALSLPLDLLGREGDGEIQNADGTFVPMVGFDDVGEGTLG